jgi:uncharacterized protein YjbI with pentapeptide repeats
LSGANSSNIYINRSSFNYAKLIAANLIDADPCNISLKGADLSNANLSGASLSSANLHGANLSGANLHGANLRYCRLTFTNFSNVDVTNTQFTESRGISLSLKRDLIARGAIFDES